MLFPECNGFSHFLNIAETIIDRGNAADLTAGVVEEFFDHVDRYSKRSKFSSECATKVVQNEAADAR